MARERLEYSRSSSRGTREPALSREEATTIVVVQNRRPIATSWTPVRPTGIVAVSLIGTLFATADGGLGGLLGGLSLVSLAVLLSFTAVSRMRVYADGLDLNLGPFGIFRRYLPRDQIVLTAHNNVFVGSLVIERETGRVIGPLRRVRVWDRWPEDALRSAGYRFAR